MYFYFLKEKKTIQKLLCFSKNAVLLNIHLNKDKTNTVVSET